MTFQIAAARRCDKRPGIQPRIPVGFLVDTLKYDMHL